jgi:predicted HNH restriction endonuclease
VVYREGAVKRVSVNAYERNPAARRACIEHYGTSCRVCGFNFGQVYGPQVDGLIHVHHLRALSNLGDEYIVDPIADLLPVCPSCHAALHSRSPAYTIEEVRAFLGKKG